MTGSRQRGIALLVTILGILALEAVAAGALLVAGRQVRAAHVSARALQLQLAAQGAGALALAQWNADSAAVLPPDSSHPLPSDMAADDGVQLRVRLRRIAGSLYLLRAEAASAVGERVAIGALVRTAAAQDYDEDLPAAAELGGTLAGAGGVISGNALVTCADTAPAGPGVALRLPDGAAFDSGPHTIEGAVLADAAPGDLFRVAGVDLRSLARARPPGTVAATPVAIGDVCLTGDADNWGAPGDSEHACAGHYPVVHIAGDLLLTGMGQGVLLVDGDAVFAPGARYRGIVLVRGSFAVQAGALVEGAVRVARDLILADGQLRHEPCVIARVANRAAGLRGPFRTAGHWWLPF